MTDIAKIAEGLTPVPGYEGRYAINQAGQVFSLARTFTRYNRGRMQVVSVPARIMKHSYSRKGYAQVSLSKNNKAKTIELHRLVCRVFHGEPPTEKHQAAHLDGDRKNCHADNLVWATESENHAHKRLHGTMLTGERVKNSKLTTKKAIEIVSLVAEGLAKREVARRMGVSEKAVRKIVAGDMWADETLAVRAHLERER